MSSGLVDTKLAHVQDRRVGAVASPPTGAPEFHCAPIGLDALRSQWGQRAHYQQHHQRECGRRPWRGHRAGGQRELHYCRQPQAPQRPQR
jgi:hypothetical protein